MIEMELTGKQKQQFCEALIHAFPSKDRLRMMLSCGLEWDLDRVAGGNTLEDIVFNLLRWTESRGQLTQLLEAALAENPLNPKLIKLKKSYLNPITEDEINNLKLILDKIDFRIVKSSFLRILPHGSIEDNVKLKTVENLDDIIRILSEDFTKNNSVVKLIEQIIHKLEINSDEYQELVNWLKPLSSKLNIEISLEPSDTKLDYHLLFIVTPESGEKLRLEAAYIQNGSLKALDYHQETNSSNDLANTKARKGNLYSSFQDVSKQVQKIIEFFIENINDDFIIEIYLPYNYLYENIDNTWCITNDFKESVPILEKFPVVLHSTERLKGLSLKTLKEGWQKLISLLDETPNPDEIHKRIETVRQTHKLDWKKLEKKLLKDKIGIKLTKPLETSSREPENFIKAIINGGVPIAFWTRCRSSTKRKLEQIDCYLTVECLENNFKILIEEICSFRRNAYLEEEPIQHLGYHLGFLCDNPQKIEQLKPKPLKF